MIVTHVGGPTALLELGGWTLLTDPTFDAPGGHYAFGWGTSSDKLTAAAISADAVPHLDAVLLSHDQHADNLDSTGRALLPTADAVLTTRSAAKRLHLDQARGMVAGDRIVLTAPGREPLSVTAMPGRHGPPLSRPFSGDVIGFLLELGATTVWVTGDTVLSRKVRRAVADLRIDVLLLHVGGVRFPISGPVRYTLTAARAAELVDLVRPGVAVPVHYEGWTHFKDGRRSLEEALAGRPVLVRDCVRWLPLGEPTELTATDL